MHPIAQSETATNAVDNLRRIIQSIRTSARRAEREIGLSGAQLFVLQKLAESPAQSVNELASRTLTHQSSVSVVVSRLEERGLVARTRSPVDRRHIELTLTPAGLKALRHAPVMPQMRLVEAVRNLPETDLRHLDRLLRRLAEALGASRLAPAMLFADEKAKRSARKPRSSRRTAR